MSRLLIQTVSVAPRPDSYPDLSSFGLEDRAAWSQKRNAVSFFNMLPAAPILGKTQLSASCHHSLNWSTNLGLVSVRAVSRGGRSDASSQNNYSGNLLCDKHEKKPFSKATWGTDEEPYRQPGTVFKYVCFKRLTCWRRMLTLIHF